MSNWKNLGTVRKQNLAMSLTKRIKCIARPHAAVAHTFSSSALCFCSRATSSSEVVDALCFISTLSTRPSRIITSSDGRPPPPDCRPPLPPGALRDLACPEVEVCPWCGAGAAERCFLAGFVGLRSQAVAEFRLDRSCDSWFEGMLSSSPSVNALPSRTTELR